MTLKGHGKCFEHLLRFNTSMLILGGGGDTVKNVSRCWTYETSIALNVDLPDDLPHTLNYMHYFLPDKKLHIQPKENSKNHKSKAELCEIVMTAIDNLRNSEHAPSVAFQDPQIVVDDDQNKDENNNPDQRQTQRETDKQIVPDNEFYD